MPNLMNMSEDKIKTIIKVAAMYYLDEMSQQEIANRMKISRPQVSRMLTLAKANGFVNIQLNDPFSEEKKAERWLIDTFGLTNAAIIDTPDNDYMGVTHNAASVLTEILSSCIKENCSLGVMAGLTLNSISEEIGFIQKKNLKVVPLVGSSGLIGKWQSNLNVRNFGERFKCRYLQFNAPTIVANVAVREALLEEREIKEVLEAGKHSTIALVGVGQIQKTATIINAGLFSPEDLDELSNKGAVASICNSFLDRDGHIVNFSGYNRMIGISAEDLRKIPTVIGVAWGPDKVPAITATLLGQWVDMFITTRETAKQIMDYYNGYIATNKKMIRGEYS